LAEIIDFLDRLNFPDIERSMMSAGEVTALACSSVFQHGPIASRVPERRAGPAPNHQGCSQPWDGSGPRFAQTGAAGGVSHWRRLDNQRHRELGLPTRYPRPILLFSVRSIPCRNHGSPLRPVPSEYSSAGVAVVQTAEDRQRCNPPFAMDWPMDRRILGQGEVSAAPVVV